MTHSVTRQSAADEVVSDTTAIGTEFHMLAPARDAAPTLLLFAMAGKDTLVTEPHCCVGRILHGQGWNVVSLDLPCHGLDRRSGETPEIVGWAARMAAGEDIVASFRQRVNDILEHLVQAGVADPDRIAAAGTSRGGFMAFHAAAGNPCIRAVAAFSPVANLLALTEFKGLQDNVVVRRSALLNLVAPLADRAAWVTMGNADTRVDTDKTLAFVRALTVAAPKHDITLHLLPVPRHTSRPEWHESAAVWFQQTFVTTRPSVKSAKPRKGPR